MGGVMHNHSRETLYVFARSNQKYSRTLKLLSALATVMALAFPAFGQRTTGTLRGQVLDPSGAVVPNAQVTITNQETAVVTKVTTTSAGTYNVPSLLPGLYKLSMEAKGFKTLVKTDVNVVANQDNEANG